jgi:hypothetical protein
MELERAKEVNSLITKWVATCFIGNEDPGPPPEFDLAEALEAQKMLSGYKEPAEGGGYRSYTTTDPRGIAALYVMGHYQASDPSHAEPLLAGGGVALVLVNADTTPEDLEA